MRLSLSVPLTSHLLLELILANHVDGIMPSEGGTGYSTRAASGDGIAKGEDESTSSHHSTEGHGRSKEGGRRAHRRRRCGGEEGSLLACE